MKVNSLLLIFTIIITATLGFSINNIFAEELETIQIEIKYTNGDRVDFSEIKIKVYQDFDKTPILEKKLENNPDFISLPENHRYKIEVFVNGMYADVGYVQSLTTSTELEIKIPLSGGIKFNIFYNDGETPIEGARIVIKSNDNTEWRQAITNKQGETLRYWIQSTTKQEEYYIANVFLGEIFLKSYFPIKIQAGISKDEKIITDIPEIIEDLITITLFKDATTKSSSSDGRYVVTLTDVYSEKSISDEINFRGEAQFSNLKSGTYVAKITSDIPNEAKLWPESYLQIIGKSNQFNIFKLEQVDSIQPTESIQEEIESCNCVAFRFDDVQDYWLNDVQIEVMKTFYDKQIPVTLGIIADSFGEDIKMKDFVNEPNHRKYLEIASHGIGNTPFTEFSEKEQDEKIKESVNKIDEKLNVKTKIFIPPQNRFNEETKQVLINNGFTHISASLLHSDSPPFPLKNQKLYRFPEIGTTGNFDPKQNIFVGLPYEETYSQLLEGLKKYGFAVITSHPQEFSVVVNGTYVNEINSNQIDELEKLIDKIQKDEIKIVPIGQINLDSQTREVPLWIKNNAGWWADGQIDDETFVQGIEYLVQKNIISVSERSQTPSNNQNIPLWIKNNAGWWADGQIDDETFVQGIEYLVKNGIIAY